MPKYESPNIAWPTSDYIWKNGTMPDVRKRHIRQLIASGKTHLFREVELEHPGYPRPYSHESIDAILDETESEFKVLDSLGIRVPDFTWRVVDTDPRKLRVISEVEVVEGFTPAYASSEAQTIRNAMRTYFDMQRGGHRLFDIDSAAQYVVGVPRTQLGEMQPSIHLVDIEPRFA